MLRHVIVDRNAIYENDRDCGDRPPLTLYNDEAEAPVVMHGLEVWYDGVRIGTFRSQSAQTKSVPGRPHVWFEASPQATLTPIHRQTPIRQHA